VGRKPHILGASVAGLLVLAVLALVVHDEGASTQVAASGPRARADSSALLPDVDQPAEDATTTVPSETVPTTAATQPVAATRVPTTAALTGSSTTTKPNTTVATGPAPTSPPTTVGRTVTVTPGQGVGAYTVSGTGCLGPDAGAGMYFYDVDGQLINGDGGSAMPDGTWAVPVVMPQGAGPGLVTIKAFCTNAMTNVKYFDYAPVTVLVS
jgi:hypothetical protein